MVSHINVSTVSNGEVGRFEFCSMSTFSEPTAHNDEILVKMKIFGANYCLLRTVCSGPFYIFSATASNQCWNFVLFQMPDV